MIRITQKSGIWANINKKMSSVVSQNLDCLSIIERSLGLRTFEVFKLRSHHEGFFVKNTLGITHVKFSLMFLKKSEMVERKVWDIWLGMAQLRIYFARAPEITLIHV